jgi:hypothetical protein
MGGGRGEAIGPCRWVVDSNGIQVSCGRKASVRITGHDRRSALAVRRLAWNVMSRNGERGIFASEAKSSAKGIGTNGWDYGSGEKSQAFLTWPWILPELFVFQLAMPNGKIHFFTAFGIFASTPHSGNIVGAP